MAYLRYICLKMNFYTRLSKSEMIDYFINDNIMNLESVATKISQTPSRVHFSLLFYRRTSQSRCLDFLAVCFLSTAPHRPYWLAKDRFPIPWWQVWENIYRMTPACRRAWGATLSFSSQALFFSPVFFLFLGIVFLFLFLTALANFSNSWSLFFSAGLFFFLAIVRWPRLLGNALMSRGGFAVRYRITILKHNFYENKSKFSLIFSLRASRICFGK